MKKNKNSKAGFIISGELVLIATVLVIGLLVGSVAVRDAVLGELQDTASAYAMLDQSYGFQGANADTWNNDRTEGTEFVDGVDYNDTLAYSVLLDQVAEAP